MASFADVERFFERIFERSSASLFRTRIQAVQIEHRVERAMERARTHQGSRTVVPGRYRVRLNPTDLSDLAPEQPDAVALAARLADAVLAFARAHAYHVPARPVVVLVADPSLARGQVEVDVGPVQAAVPAVEPPSASQSLLATGPAPTVEPVVAPMPDAAPAVVLEPAREGIRGDGTQTLVFRRPAPPATRALLRVREPDGTERTVEVDGSPLDLGRSHDNRLVLSDARVSRRHGRLQARRGALVYTDLGSTNGSRVNGIRVDEIALGLGDRVQVGDTVLVVEILPRLNVDGFVLTLWLIRILFLVLLYGFLFAVARILMRDLRAASKGPTELGRLVVLASPHGEPPVATSFPLDAVTTLGRDVNNTIVIEDPFASAEHSALTFRGRAWYVEDLESTNGTFVNGVPVDRVAALGFGDELQVGEVRFRLDRGRE